MADDLAELAFGDQQPGTNPALDVIAWLPALMDSGSVPKPAS